MQKGFSYTLMAKSVAFFVFLCVFPQKMYAEELSFYIQPYLPATELVKRFNPLVRYLSDRLGTPVRIKISKNYDRHIDLAGEDKADISYLGPGPYVKMVEKYGEKPLLARLEVRNSPVYYGMIIVQQDSPVQSLADLKGKGFAFGDLHSTMNFLVPRHMLQMAGVGLGDLGKYEFLGTHHDIALAVLGGYYDAGGIKEEVFYRYEKRGLRMLAKSQPVSEHVFVTRSNMDDNLVRQLKKHLLDLNKDRHGLEILKSIKASITGIQSVRDEDYDAMRLYMAEGEDKK